MDHYINPMKTALTVGAFIGGWHVVWSLLVAFGWAQPLVNFSLWAHMVSLPFVVKTFDFSAAITVVIIATLIGYVVGYLFALLWNQIHRN